MSSNIIPSLIKKATNILIADNIDTPHACHEYSKILMALADKYNLIYYPIAIHDFTNMNCFHFASIIGYTKDNCYLVDPCFDQFFLNSEHSDFYHLVGINMTCNPLVTEISNELITNGYFKMTSDKFKLYINSFIESYNQIYSNDIDSEIIVDGLKRKIKLGD